LANNGTLVSNWYEEQILREATGEGRSIPRGHIPKKSHDVNDVDEVTVREQDDTKTRILGGKVHAEMVPISKDYGNFPEKSYEYRSIKDKVFHDFFKGYLDQGKSPVIYKHETREVNQNGSNKAMFSKTNQSMNYVDPQIDRFVPFHQSKEVSFWNKTLDKADGTFVQQDHKDNLNKLTEKIAIVCQKKGWLTLRTLRIYLKSATKGKEKVPRANFKFFLTNFGVFPNEKEMDAVYAVYDAKKQDEVLFNQVLDEMIVLSEQRIQMMNALGNQIFPNADKISVKCLDKLLLPKNHPDVILLRKSPNELKNDFFSLFKENEEISAMNFINLLKDISFTIDSDEDFLRILSFLGLNY